MAKHTDHTWEYIKRLPSEFIDGGKFEVIPGIEKCRDCGATRRVSRIRKVTKDRSRRPMVRDPETGGYHPNKVKPYYREDLAEKHIKLTQAMMRHGITNPATYCTGCQTKIPRYKGKYPTKCPNCGERLKVIPKRSYKTKSRLGESMEDLLTLITELESSATTPGDAADRALGNSAESKQMRLWDNAMVYVNQQGLLDPYEGQKIQADGTNLELYFSKNTEEIEMQELVHALEEMSLNTGKQEISGTSIGVNCARSPTTGGWVVTINVPLLQPGNNATGDVGVGVDMSNTATNPPIV